MTNAYTFQTLQVADKPVGISIESTPENAFITCERDCRYRYDGEEPTSESGHLLRDGEHLELHGELHIKQFRAISTGSVPAALQITLEKT